MGRISTFLFGLVVGAVLVFGAQRYHVVRSAEGLHLIPKTKATLAEAYVDIRDFRLADWTNHPELAAAVLKARKEHLLGDSARGSFRDSIENALNALTSDRG